MEVRRTSLAGVWEAISDRAIDDRGSFSRLFCDREMQAAHDGRRLVQINLSHTRLAGSVRGLHFQNPPHADAKWIRCIRGRVWDVAVDLRNGSPTFLKWHAVELTPLKMNALFLPEGFAHGFQVLEPDSEILYLHTDFYNPEAEGGIRWDEPRIAIDWPLAVTNLSDRDRNHSFLNSDSDGLIV